MKVFIPFNSNDFNSVFTTLSISPCAFYPNRKYSFKRASTSLLNENEEFLLGFDRPIFHHRDLDKNYGFPILVEIEIEKNETDLIEDKTGIKYLLIDSTIYLFNGFKLIFRHEKELKEIFAKSLKSIETKFAGLAKSNSVVINDDIYKSQLPNPRFPSVNPQINSKTFKKERKLNRLLGATLGSSIAFSNSTSKEWQEISNLLRFLNNNLSLYLNKIGEYNDFEKKQSLEIIQKISYAYESIETLDVAILFESNIPSAILSSFKEYKIFNIPIYNLIIEGLLNNQKVDLPINLKLEKLKRAINSKFNTKYPNNYIERINNDFNEIKNSIEKQITFSRKGNKLTFNKLLIPEFINGKLSINIPDALNNTENEYLKQIISFFIQVDKIQDIDYFFINRKEILIELANYFKSNIEGFDTSRERDYLIELLKSFDSLRGGFQIGAIKNEVLKSIAILFTSGRDLLRFIENNEREEITNSLIYYSIWGAIYGVAILPKTLTEIVTGDSKNLNVIITAFNSILNNFNLVIDTKYIEKVDNEKDDTFKEPNKVMKTDGTYIDSYSITKPNLINNSSFSKSAILILDLLELNKKLKLSEFNRLSKAFKVKGFLENIIKNELSDRVVLIKEGRTMYAKLKDDSQLFR